MVSLNIFFDDLDLEAQERVWRKIRQELLASGRVEPKLEDETDEEFQDRLTEETDEYINCRNSANRFEL